LKFLLIAISPKGPEVANHIVDYYILPERIKQVVGKYRN